MSTKEMVYKEKFEQETLSHGVCFGFEYYILSFGLYPVAYVKIPQKHQFFLLHRSEFDDKIIVHGGITYSDVYLKLPNGKIVYDYFIGWDYAHNGDCRMPFQQKGKKWTVEEIEEDVAEVCKQLNLFWR